MPRPAPPRSRSSPTPPPIPPSSPLISSRRPSMTRWPRASWSPTPRAARRGCRDGARPSGAPRLGTASSSRRRCAGEQSGVVMVAGLDQGLAVVDAYGAEHLEIQTADAADGRRPGHQRRRRLRRLPQPGEPRRLRRGLQSRAAHRRQLPVQRRPRRRRPSCAASTSSTTTGRRWPVPVRRRPRWPTPRGSRRTVRRSTSASRTDLRGRGPTGGVARQACRPRPLAVDPSTRRPCRDPGTCLRLLRTPM